MSKNRQMILISPPAFLADGFDKELIISNGHVCSYCHGLGFMIDKLDQTKTSCKVCKGTGRLKAEITIRWLPQNKP